MRCKYCGEKLTKGIDVCPNCGQVNKGFFNSDKFNKKIVIIAAAAVVAVIAAVGVAFAVTGGDDIDVKMIDEEAGEYLLINVPTNYTFEIDNVKAKDAGQLTVYDIYGNKIKNEQQESQNTVKIKAPDGGYEKGEIYTLDLKGKGSFAEEEYADAKKITFVVEQKETVEIVYQESVIELKSDEVNEDTENKAVTIDGKYKNGDIIVADGDNDKIDEIYKLADAKVKDNKTTAAYVEPEADEVYEDLDVFYYDDVDFSEATIDEDAFTGALEEMGVLDAFIEESYADGKSKGEVDIEVSKINYAKAKATYEFEYTIKDPKDSDRQLQIRFEVKDKILVKANLKTAMVNNSLIIASGLEFSVKGEEKEATEKSIKKAIEEYQSGLETEESKGEYEVPLVPVVVPVAGPVSVYADIGLTADVTFTAEFNAGADASLEFTQGIIYSIKKHKLIKKYADITGDFEADMMVKGKLEAFAGAYLDTGAEIPALIKAGVEAKGGPYLDGEGCFSIEGIPKDIKKKGYYYVEIGLMCKADAKVDVIGFDEKEFNLVEKKKELYKVSEYLSLKETNLKDTYYGAGDGIDIGELKATYHNVIDDKDVIKPIEEYTLYIDNKKAEVEDGVIQKELKPGEYEFKIKWEYEGDKFEEKKTVEITEFDPLGYFASISEIGNTYSSIDSKYHVWESNRTDGWVLMTSASGKFDFTFNATVPDAEIPDYTHLASTDKCYKMAGTAEDIFGIEKPIAYAEFEKATNTDLGYGHGVDLDTGMYDGVVDLILVPGESGYFHMLLEDIRYREDIKPDTMVYIQGKIYYDYDTDSILQGYFSKGEIDKAGGY